MYPDVLPSRALRLWGSLSRLPALGSFYLGGGTGLALHLGHRRSDDLDFFSRRIFKSHLVAHALSAIGSPKHLSLAGGSVECWLGGFKMQFRHYPYRLLRPLHKTRYDSVADPLDITLMKLIAISQRDSKRDFVDLACFLRCTPHISLGQLLESLRRKYGKMNRAHLLRALTYFADAESEPMPHMRSPVEWHEIKRLLEDAVRELLE